MTYDGAPVAETVAVTKDVAECGKEKTTQKIAVGPDRGLSNTVVWVKDLQGPATSKLATLDQRGCEFHPHVLATMPGEVEILNSDGILHNIHTTSTLNPPLNKAQPKFKKVMTATFEKPEIIRVRCDVHDWMHGWIVVVPNPYFAVTGKAGTTKIENVPPGTHTLEAWHELLGSQTRQVEVNERETTKVTVALKT